MDLSGQSTSNVDRIAGAVAEAVRTLTSGSLAQGEQCKFNNLAEWQAVIEMYGLLQLSM